MSFLLNPYMVAPASPTDPYWDDVVLLLHMEGADEGTTFTDSSDSAHTVTAVGHANTESSISKFGSTSLQGDGSGDWLSITDHADFDLGISSGLFTIEGFFRVSNPSGTNVLLSKGGGVAGWNGTTGNQYQLFTESNTLYWQFWNGSGVATLAAGIAGLGWSANTWYHMAVACDGTDTEAYFNGTRWGSYSSSSYGLPTAATKVRLMGSVSNHSTNGYADDFRITKGTARYTGATLTIPTATFPDA